MSLPIAYYDLHNSIRFIKAPLEESAMAYAAALGRMFDSEPVKMNELMRVENLCCRGGCLVVEEGEPCRQAESDRGRLLVQAREAQQALKRALALGSPWASMELDGSSQQQTMQGSAGWELGLLPWIDEVYDPGLKPLIGTTEKAQHRCDEFLRPRFECVLDISRLALRFNMASRLLSALGFVKQLFAVVELHNRFARPTAFGWMDILVYVRVPLAAGGTHVAELQLQLREFVQERLVGKRCYMDLKRELPKLGVIAEDIDEVERIISETLKPDFGTYVDDATPAMVQSKNGGESPWPRGLGLGLLAFR